MTGLSPSASDARWREAVAHAEMIHGGRYITGQLSEEVGSTSRHDQATIANIRERLSGAAGPEQLDSIWTYSMSPSGRTLDRAGARESTRHLAEEYAKRGGDGSIFSGPAYLSRLFNARDAERMTEWPIYRAAFAGPVLPPVVVTATGEDTWEVAIAGTGEPEVYVLDFDHDADLDWQQENLTRYTAARDALRRRVALVPGGVMAEFERGVEDETERVRGEEAYAAEAQS